MKKLLLLIAPVLFLAGCYQKTTDLTKPLQQLSQAVQQINSKVDTLSERIAVIETKKAMTESSTSDAFSGWQTYTNSLLGFSLKLPPDWVAVSVFDGTETAVPTGNDIEGVPVFQRQGDKESYITFLADSGPPYTCEAPQLINFTIDGVIFRKGEIDDNDQWCYIGSSQTWKNFIISASNKIDQALLDQILGSLKFIK